MALSAIAWTAMILVLVFLTLTFAPNWSLAILILVGKIAQAFDGKKTAKHTANGHSGLGPDSGPGPDLGPGPDQGPGPDSGPGPGPDSGPGPDQGSGPDQGLGLDHHHDAPEGNATLAFDIEMGQPPSTAVGAAGEERTQLESTSTTLSSSQIKYQVFLNFKSSDIHRAILDQLYKTSADAGILIFRDSEEISVGDDDISSKALEAIKQSRISIAILSIDYAFSKRCLMELVQMWDCRKTNGQTIIPVFYNASRSDVINQAGDFGKAFRLHKNRVDSKTIKKWREALRGMGDLTGHSGRLFEGYDADLAEQVILRVAGILRDDGLAVTDEPNGIDLHVQEMMRKLGVAHREGRETEVHGEEVRVIGICGVPGARKTTLVKVVFNKMRDLFDGCSFLPGISSKGIHFLRRMLIADLQMDKSKSIESASYGSEGITFRNKKVLIVLDDVDQEEQIKALAGDLTWFGPGSRIIVMTNNRRVLNAFDVGADGHGTVEEHNIEPMSDDDALQLRADPDFQGDAQEEVF